MGVSKSSCDVSPSLHLGSEPSVMRCMRCESKKKTRSKRSFSSMLALTALTPAIPGCEPTVTKVTKVTAVAVSPASDCAVVSGHIQMTIMTYVPCSVEALICLDHP